jgi:hypothetical protein
MTDETQDTQEPERYIEAIPKPSLSFECECGAVGTLCDPRAWMAYGNGQVLPVKCGNCGVHVRLVHPQRPLIEVPQGPNRHQRRAMAVQQRIVKG